MQYGHFVKIRGPPSELGFILWFMGNTHRYSYRCIYQGEPG